MLADIVIARGTKTLDVERIPNGLALEGILHDIST